MFVNDKDALQYASRLILLLVPLLATWFNLWSWAVEIVLLLAVFLHNRSAGFRLTGLLLLAGYMLALPMAGTQFFFQIGFTPWAGILFLGLKRSGLSTLHSMFWGLLVAATLGALPVVPMAKLGLDPVMMQQKVKDALEFYQNQGTVSALEKQGMTSTEFEGYLALAMPTYYKLMPSLAGIMAMLALGLAYLIYRLGLKRVEPVRPFIFWRLPWYAVWVAITALAAYLGGDALHNDFFEIAGLNAMLITAALALISGLACLLFMLKHPKLPKLFFIFFVFFGVFFPFYMLVCLILVGVFDWVINFRRILEITEGGKQ